MSRIESFYSKYPALKPQEEAPKKKRVGRPKGSKNKVQKDPVEVKLDWEMQLIKEQQRKKEESKSLLDKVEGAMERLGIPVAEGHVLCDMSFVNKMRNDLKEEMEMEEMKVNLEDIRAVVREEIGRSNETLLAIEKEKTRQLELQLELARLQFTPAVIDEKEEAPVLYSIPAYEGIPYTPVISRRTGYSIHWSKVEREEIEIPVLISVIMAAIDIDVNILSSKAMMEAGGAYSGAVQFYNRVLREKHGPWKQFVNEFVL